MGPEHVVEILAQPAGSGAFSIQRPVEKRPAKRDLDQPSHWFVGGGEVSAECLRLRLADEVRYTIVPILIGDGISFFQGLDTDVALHLREATAHKSGMVALRYEVRK
jgi:dihydrofolate reductase